MFKGGGAGAGAGADRPLGEGCSASVGLGSEVCPDADCEDVANIWDGGDDGGQDGTGADD